MARAWTKILGRNFMLGISSSEDKLGSGINFMAMGDGRSYRLAWRYLKYAKKNNFSHIYCREEKMLLFMFFYNKIFFRLPITFCYELHHLVYTRGLWRFFLLNRVHKIVSITSAMKNILVRSGYTEERILVSPDAVDPSLFDVKLTKDEARRKLNLPLNKKIVIYTGDIVEPWKGVGTLYEASKNFGDEYLFLLVGSKPHHVEYFRSIYPDRPNFLLVGHKPHKEIPLYLKAADIAVLPNSGKDEISRISTSPMKMFEYMAAGLPIVASNISSIREILDEKSAVLVEPDNPEALANGIRKIFDDKFLLNSLSDQVKRNIFLHTWDNRVKNVTNFIARH